MAQLIACPECTKALQVPDELLGTTVQCPECKHTFTATITEASEAPAEAAPSKRRDKDREDEVDVAKPMTSPGQSKPAKVSNLAVMSLIAGLWAVLLAISAGASLGAMSCGLFCLWPGIYYCLVVGILAITKGAALMGPKAASHPPPVGVAIMLIINIINLDVVSLVLGIIMLMWCNDEEVKAYLAKG